MCLLQHNFWMICKILWTIMYVSMILEQHLTNFLLHVLNLKKSSWILRAFEKLQKKAHLRDVIEAWGMSYVVKFINFCSLHIQFYVWLKYLYDRMFFFQIYKKWDQKLDLIQYIFLLAGLINWINAHNLTILMHISQS